MVFSAIDSSISVFADRLGEQGLISFCFMVSVVTTTPTMVDDLRRHGFNCDIRAWTRGVDRDIFTSSLRKEKLLGRPILLSVGRVSKEKGFDSFDCIKSLFTFS